MKRESCSARCFHEDAFVALPPLWYMCTEVGSSCDSMARPRSCSCARLCASAQQGPRLRALQAVRPEDTVLGQYSAAGEQKGYLEDETVPKGSKTPTFATCVMRIHNERCGRAPPATFRLL